MSRLTVRQGRSAHPDPARAVAEVSQEVAADDARLTLVFCSSTYDRKRLAEAFNDAFSGPVVGCTTAGEIGRDGYTSGGLVAMSFASDELTAKPVLIPELSRFDTADAADYARDLAAPAPGHGRFGLLLIDGLSVSEEHVVAALHHAFSGMPVVGGSAGDGLRFEKTAVFANGRFHDDAAVFTVVETSLPFTTLRVQHFEPTDERLVITAAEPGRRVVTEINGRPAAREYARAVGLEVEELTPMVFAAHPVMLRIGGEYFVRSIQKVNPDGSLTFFCAIDTGLVLRVARGLDMVASLQAAFEEAEHVVGQTSAVIGCDCILRRLELEETGRLEDMSALVSRLPFVGFSTYGEQSDGIHVNQTFTGVMLGGAG